MADTKDSRESVWGARLLKPFAEVRACEVSTVLVLAVTIFLILTAYYLLKVVREPLILTSHGAEVKAYAAGGQALLLIPVLLVHGFLARRVGRLVLIGSVLLFCASNLVVFAVLYRMGISIGLPFYLWVGTFNFLLVATFWSFANDVYTLEQGKRLFPVVGVGPTVGSLAGAALAGWMLGRYNPEVLMLASGTLLVVCFGLFAWVNRHQQCRPKDRGAVLEPSEPLRGPGGLEALLSDRYLLLIAVIALLNNWVTNSGEYILDSTLVRSVREAGTLSGPEMTRYIGQFKSSYFLWINALALVSQLFLVSRILKYLGVGTAMLMLPLVAMAGASSMALFPVLWVIRTAKIAEKQTEYSVQNTAANALYLVVSRDAKYKTKALIDSFVVRVGDVCAAAGIWVGVQIGTGPRGFATVNVILCAIWLVAAWRVGSIYRVRSGTEGRLPAAPARQAVSSA